MKNYLLLFSVLLLLGACKDKSSEKTATKTTGNTASPEHTISKNGLGDLKIGMTKTEIEKMLNQSLVMMHAKDTGEIWGDTATVKYADMDVALYFQKGYSEDHPDEMELSGLSTSSPLCKTASGIGVGDDRDDILAAYDDNPITMGPENIMLNDTTWGLSKTNYYINISDDKYDKQINFLLVNKKIARLEASLQMGD
jgi:hypothetical protein